MSSFDWYLVLNLLSFGHASKTAKNFTSRNCCFTIRHWFEEHVCSHVIEDCTFPKKKKLKNCMGIEDCIKERERERERERGLVWLAFRACMQWRANNGAAVLEKDNDSRGKAWTLSLSLLSYVVNVKATKQERDPRCFNLLLIDTILCLMLREIVWMLCWVFTKTAQYLLLWLLIP